MYLMVNTIFMEAQVNYCIRIMNLYTKFQKKFIITIKYHT